MLLGIKLAPKTRGPKVVSGAEPIGLARPDQTQVQDHSLSPKRRIFRIYQNRLLSHQIWDKVPNRMTLAKGVVSYPVWTLLPNLNSITM
jgi:hypothetical protein